jgi:hypothetical protein
MQKRSPDHGRENGDTGFEDALLLDCNHDSEV